MTGAPRYYRPRSDGVTRLDLRSWRTRIRELIPSLPRRVAFYLAELFIGALCLAGAVGTVLWLAWVCGL